MQSYRLNSARIRSLFALLLTILLVSSLILPFHYGESAFTPISDPNLPQVVDSNLRVEKVITGLALPTSMVFLDEDDILILEKNTGKIRYVQNGVLQENSLLDIVVKTESERGLLGIAILTGTPSLTLFLYYTEEDSGDVRNRVYRYSLTGNNIADKTLILDLPGTPGPNHDGGKLAIGPDNRLYAIIGDLNRDGKLQNYPAGADPDNTSVILKVNFDGTAAANVLSGAIGLESYYAYGIRNSFGMDFDPVTGTLWSTENGPADYDEINVVTPGFNSGWEKVMGPISRTSVQESDLVAFTGSNYADPVFSWLQAIGVTDIEFLSSTTLGAQYANNIFIGDINNGNLYYFQINDNRNGINFDNLQSSAQAGLADLVADDISERNAVTFGTGFGGITDIETGLDGYLYVLTFSGNIYRVVPIQQVSRPIGDTANFADSVIETASYFGSLADQLNLSSTLSTHNFRSLADQLNLSSTPNIQKTSPVVGGGGGGSPSSAQTQLQTYPDSYFVDNPLSRVAVIDLKFANLQGASTSQFSIGEQINIATSFKNNQNKIQSYAYIIQIIDPEGITVSVNLRLGNLPAGGTTAFSFSWSPEGFGAYSIKVLIWDGLGSPLALSSAGVSVINVIR